MVFIKFIYLFVVICPLLRADAAANPNFPSDIPLCKAGDTNCIVRSATAVVRRYGKTGYPLANFPVIEPFSIKSVDISDGRQGSLSLKLNFRNIIVGGLSGVQIERAVGFDRNPQTSKFEMYGSFPKINIRAKYTADGRVLVLPIRGDGDADVNLINPKFSVKFKPSLEKRGGKTYMSVDKLKVLVEPESMTLHLSNLFGGEQALSENINQFLNANWKDVWSELQPSVHAAIAEVVKSVVTAVFSRFAYEDIYLD